MIDNYRLMINNTLKVIFFMSLFFCALFLEDAKKAYAYNDEVRIGLTGLFSGQEEITLQNTSLALGYMIDEEFSEFAKFTSESGFLFEPARGYYIDLGLSMSTYRAALQRFSAIDNRENYYLSVQGPSSFRIYYGPFNDYTEAGNYLEKLSQAGYSNAKVLGSSNYRVMLFGENIELLIDVDDNYMYPQLAPVGTSAGVNLINIGSRKYRGRLEIGTYGKTTLTAVNIVPLEEYLYGVVPCEMPSSWPKEALKAQAVCARSYALAKGTMRTIGSAKTGYKLVDTIASQVYRGYMYEEESTSQAVDATRGKMITYNNKVIAAYYFSSSAGKTESAEEVWGFELPYLQSVTDEYEGAYATSPWKVELTLSELSGLIRQYSTDIGDVKDIKITGQSETGRVSSIKVYGTAGAISLQTSAIRNVLGLKGTKFILVKNGDDPDKVTVKSYNGVTATTELNLQNCYVLSAEGTSKIDSSLEQYIVKTCDNFYVFGKNAPESADSIFIYGIGSGHGVGMSQSGAAGMAAKGKTYIEILKYYFKGCQI